MAGLWSIGAMAQDKAPKPAAPPNPPGAVPAMTPPTAPPDKDKLSAAAGAYFARTVTNELVRQLGIDARTDVDLGKMLQAFSNVVVGAAGAMTPDDAGKVLQEQFTYQKGLAQEEIKKMTDAAPQTKAASEKFMQTIEASPGVTKVASGVVYKVIKQGDGEMPAAQDGVTISFKATLPDGTDVLDVEHRPMQTLTPPPFTAGLSQALELMKTGSHWMVYVPYTQAFNDKPQVPDAKRGYKIPPFSALVFDVELESVQHHAAPPPTMNMGQMSAPAGVPMPNVTSSSIVRVPSAEDMKKGEQPRVLTDAEVEAARKEAMQKAAQTNGTK